MDGSNGSPVRARCVAVLPLPPSPRMPRRPRRKGTPFCALCTAWRICMRGGREAGGGRGSSVCRLCGLRLARHRAAGACAPHLFAA
eukprot:3534925-Prymnesium_polylepis.1